VTVDFCPVNAGLIFFFHKVAVLCHLVEVVNCLRQRCLKS